MGYIESGAPPEFIWVRNEWEAQLRPSGVDAILACAVLAGLVGVIALLGNELALQLSPLLSDSIFFPRLLLRQEAAQDAEAEAVVEELLARPAPSRPFKLFKLIMRLRKHNQKIKYTHHAAMIIHIIAHFRGLLHHTDPSCAPTVSWSDHRTARRRRSARRHCGAPPPPHTSPQPASLSARRLRRPRARNLTAAPTFACRPAGLGGPRPGRASALRLDPFPGRRPR